MPRRDAWHPHGSAARARCSPTSLPRARRRPQNRTTPRTRDSVHMPRAVASRAHRVSLLPCGHQSEPPPPPLNPPPPPKPPNPPPPPNPPLLHPPPPPPDPPNGMQI